MLKHLALLISCLLVSVIAVGAVAAQDTVQAEGGDYYVTGTNPDGSEYFGGLEILTLGTETYSVTLLLEQPSYGIGLLNGNVFSVIIGDSSCGLTLYTITDTGLEGRWTTIGTGEAFAENATAISADDSSSTLSLEGVNVDGQPYTGTMTIARDPELDVLVFVEQVIGSTTLAGTGLVVGNVLAVGFGGQNCTLSTYVVDENRNLNGIWMTVGSATIGAETAQPINISGSHNITGTNPDGNAYSGTLNVEAQNQVHNFTWTIADSTIQGVGIMRGTSAAVGFGDDNCLVASYFQQITDRSLSGLWTAVGSDSVSFEAAIPQAEATGSDTFVGTYAVAGTNLDGSNYNGTLEIIPQDAVYELIWNIGSQTIYGVGIVVNGILFTGYGAETCAVSAYFVNPNDLQGTWAVYGSGSLGTEVATR